MVFKILNGQPVSCNLEWIYMVLNDYSWFRIVGRQVMAVKRALIDLWQLAFSYQVDPLATVQPLSAATRQAQ